MYSFCVHLCARWRHATTATPSRARLPFPRSFSRTQKQKKRDYGFECQGASIFRGDSDVAVVEGGWRAPSDNSLSRPSSRHLMCFFTKLLNLRPLKVYCTTIKTKESNKKRNFPSLSLTAGLALASRILVSSQHYYYESFSIWFWSGGRWMQLARARQPVTPQEEDTNIKKVLKNN